MRPVHRYRIRHGRIIHTNPLKSVIRAYLVVVVRADNSWVDEVAVKHKLRELVHLLRRSTHGEQCTKRQQGES